MHNQAIVSFIHHHNSQDYTISLAPIHENDKDRLAQIANDTEIAKNVGDTFPHPYTLESAEYRITTWSQKEDGYQYGIYINNEYAGNMGRQVEKKWRFSHNMHLGYRIGREYRHKWIMTKIVSEVIDYIFINHPDIHRIYARVFGWNNASRKVLEKVWMSQEAHRTESIYYEWERYDEYEYAILRNNIKKNV